jgi:putative ABC transport system ATP-binding protein
MGEIIVRVDDVSKVYSMGEQSVEALNCVSLDVEKGDFVAIMGASGSGKSTFMNIIGCLDIPTTGNYWLQGENVRGLSSDALAEVRNKKIGFVFQGFNLLARTSAVENVELPLIYGRVSSAQRRERALAALELVGLAERAGHTSKQLSGGQQQRVAIARALVNEPAIVLADEPTGNLDSVTSVEIMAIFQKLNRQGSTIIMVTHEPEIAAFTKRNIVFRDGRIISDSPVTLQADAEQMRRGM